MCSSSFFSALERLERRTLRRIKERERAAVQTVFAQTHAQMRSLLTEANEQHKMAHSWVCSLSSTRFQNNLLLFRSSSSTLYSLWRCFVVDWSFYFLVFSRGCEIERAALRVKGEIMQIADECNDVAGDLQDVAMGMDRLGRMGSAVREHMSLMWERETHHRRFNYSCTLHCQVLSKNEVGNIFSKNCKSYYCFSFSVHITFCKTSHPLWLLGQVPTLTNFCCNVWPIG